MGNEKLVYDGFHKIKLIETELKGKKVVREKIEVKSSVAGIVIDQNNRIGLVSQIRPSIDKRSLEIPAGLLDKEGLSPIEVLFEELQEECNISRDQILDYTAEPVYQYPVLIGSSDATISLYIINVTSQNMYTEVNDGSVDCVVWYSIDELREAIKLKFVADSKTLLAYHIWKDKIDESLKEEK